MSGEVSKVVVTGGLGVNGVWVVRHLLEQGCKVAIYERHADTSAAPDLSGLVACHALDVTDGDAIAAAVERDAPDCIVHMAGVLPDAINVDPRVGFLVNAGGTFNVLEAARRAGTRRVVVASARAYYGVSSGVHASGTYVPIPETYVPNRPNAYGWTKVVMEDVVRWYRDNFDLSAASLRYSGIYGPGKSVRHGMHNLISGMIESAYRHEPCHIPAGGDQCYDFLWVEDAARGTVAAALAPRLSYDAYNIGPGTKTSLRDFVKATNAAAGGDYVSIGDGLDFQRIGRDVYGILDADRARAELGFTPTYTIETGVRRYMELLAAGH